MILIMYLVSKILRLLMSTETYDVLYFNNRYEVRSFEDESGYQTVNLQTNKVEYRTDRLPEAMTYAFKSDIFIENILAKDIEDTINEATISFN